MGGKPRFRNKATICYTIFMVVSIIDLFWGGAFGYHWRYTNWVYLAVGLPYNSGSPLLLFIVLLPVGLLYIQLDDIASLHCNDYFDG
jgi:hypothetical protein